MAHDFDEIGNKPSSVTLEGKDGFVLGQMLGGKYKLLSTLGTGGMGTVYKVLQVFLNKEFALKTMDIRSVSSVSLQRFQLEAKAASSLNHPNLVHVHDFGLLEDDQPYLVMDLVNGVTFAQYLKENGPLPVDDVAAFFAPACFGLLAVHETGLVHRDIKPGNIMVVTGLPRGSEQSIKVVDFGIAKQTSRESGEIQALTATGEIFGSPLYMSPEQCAGGAIDHRSDIYSLGCVLFEMLTGTPPYFGQSALSTMMLHESGKPPTLKEASLGTEFPEALEQVVAKMLRKLPSERYQNIGLVAHDLAAVCKGGDRLTARSTYEESKPPIKNAKTVTIAENKLYSLLAATALIPATLACIGGYYFKQSQESRPVPTAANISADALAAADVRTASAEGGGTKNVAQLKKEDRLAVNRRLIEASGPITATIVNRDGGKKRMYVFPQCGIGELYTYDRAKHDDGRNLGEARGTVYLPADGDLVLKLASVDSVSALQTPSIFSKISGNEFCGLYLSNFTLETFTGEADDPLPNPPTEIVGAVLNNVQGWTNLEFVKLRQCTLRTHALEAFNKLSALKGLILDRCTFDPQELARQPFLTQLEFLNVSTLTLNGDQIVQHLAHSNVLNELHLMVLNRSTSPAAIGQLRSAQNLRIFGIKFKDSKVDDQMIKAVCQLKQVRHLQLRECVLTAAQIETLCKCRWFTHIYFSNNNYPPGAFRDRVKSIDPRIMFI